MVATTTSLHSLHRNPFPHHQHTNHHTFRRNLLSLTNTNYTSITTAALPPINSATTSTDTTDTDTTSLDVLAGHLASNDLRQADEETRRLLIALAGEAAVKRGYVFFSEVRFIAPADLRAIDRLWRAHSGGRLGYGVQRRIWERKERQDFTRFFVAVGWMKKLDTEVEQWTYRSFPSEFVWELGDNTPEGHLPLTNALRSTQLLQSILTHPAFDEEEHAEDEELESPTVAVIDGGDSNEAGKGKSGLSGARMKLKPADYSF